MKLIYCQECKDIVRLTNLIRYCNCWETWGYYKDNGLTACVSENAIVLGIDNYTFSDAFLLYKRNGDAKNFEAFTISPDCKTVERVESKPKIKSIPIGPFTVGPDCTTVKEPICQEWKVGNPLLGKVKTMFDEKMGEQELGKEQRDLPFDGRDALYQELLDVVASLNRLVLAIKEPWRMP